MAGPTINLPPNTFGISYSDFAIQPFIGEVIFPLNIPETQAILAQIAKNTRSIPSSLLGTRGVGIYGSLPAQLQSSEYLKPLTVEKYLSNSQNPLVVLSSPTCWTGKRNIDTLIEFLNDSLRQTLVQVDLLNQAYQTLNQSLPITSLEKTLGTKAYRELIGIALVCLSRFNIANTIVFLSLILNPKSQAPASYSGQLAAEMREVAFTGRYAINFVETKIPDAGKNIIPIEPGSNTTIATNLAKAVADIIGTKKV